MCNYKFPHEDHLCVQEASFLPKPSLRKLLKKAGRGVLQLTVDLAGPQHKILADEPDILWIMGWNYIPGADNAAFGRKIILQRTDGAGYLAAPTDWHRADVEAILPHENHVGLAGFVLRLRRDELERGEYRVGMLAEPEEVSGTEPEMGFVAWSGHTVTV